MAVSVKEQILYHIIGLELKNSDNFEEIVKLPENSSRTVLECWNSFLCTGSSVSRDMGKKICYLL